MEQAPALSQAIAAGMGKTVGELRALGAAGLLTADAVVKALQSQQQAVDQLFARTAVTIGNSITALDNSFTQLVGKMDQASGVSATISSAFVAASKSMDALTSDSSATYLMLSRVSNAAETLAYIIGGRLVLSTGQAIANLALSTKASIQQAAALYSATAATLTANKAEAESAKQAVLSGAGQKQARRKCDARTGKCRAGSSRTKTSYRPDAPGV